MNVDEPREFLCQGNEAVVLGALYAGLTFYGGYPITPSTEIAEGLSERLPAAGGTFMQMEDEIASIGACLGASLAGARAMTATSGPGFSLMQELIGFASISEIPVVIVNVMRLGPSTGQPTSPSQGDVMQARWGTHGDHPVIALTASSVLEAFTMTVRSFDLAERYRVPVILLLDETVGHMREKVTLPPPGLKKPGSRPKPDTPPEWYVPYEMTPSGVPPMSAFGDGYRYHVTGLIHDKMGFPTQSAKEIAENTDRLFMKLRRGFADICQTESLHGDDAELLIVAYGSVARAAAEAVEALREKGHKAGLLKLKTIWPFPRAALEQYAGKAKTMLVVEMNRGQIYREVWRVSRGRWTVAKLFCATGEVINPKIIIQKALEAGGWR